jgi:hypothetical protein
MTDTYWEDRRRAATALRLESYAIKFAIETDEEAADEALRRVLSSCVRPPRPGELAGIREQVARYRRGEMPGCPLPDPDAPPRKVSGPVEGDIGACYLNEERSPYVGVLRSQFGRCGGELFYRHPAEGSGRLGTYVCGTHLPVHDEPGMPG